MKELSIEQKAKAYDKALELARVAAFNGHQSLMEGIFPELAESEDEKIRKEIISFLKEGKPYYCPNTVRRQEWANWLEKQGEQKPAWSEKDEKVITGIINDIQKRLEDYPLEQLAEIYFKEIKWLKSLKDRYTWKPSIAQLNALSIVSKGNAPDDIEAIVSLYNDLKKLTE